MEYEGRLGAGDYLVIAVVDTVTDMDKATLGKAIDMFSACR